MRKRFFFRFALMALLFAFIFSCKDQVTIEKGFEFYPPIPDTSLFKKQLVEDRLRDYRLFNLTSILNGVDSFELRIWTWSAFNFPKEVFIFKRDSLRWYGYHYHSYSSTVIYDDGTIAKFNHSKNNLGDSVFIVKEIIPACGWKKFSDSLEYFGVKTLPTQNLIRGFEDKRGLMDGSGYIIEVASRNAYRYLFYKNPEQYTYSESKLVVAFIGMLERELGKSFSWPMSSLNQ